MAWSGRRGARARRRLDPHEPGRSSADEERAHPAVIRNPVTGCEALFLNPLYVMRLDGLTEAESRPLLEQVQRHATRPEFCCRFRWSTGAVAVWDNLFTQHYAVNDYLGHRRLMYRTTFAGPPARSGGGCGGREEGARRGAVRGRGARILPSPRHLMPGSIPQAFQQAEGRAEWMAASSAAMT